MLGFKSEIGMRGRAARDQVISSKEEEMWLSYHPGPHTFMWISLSTISWNKSYSRELFLLSLEKLWPSWKCKNLSAPRPKEAAWKPAPTPGFWERGWGRRRARTRVEKTGSTKLVPHLVVGYIVRLPTAGGIPSPEMDINLVQNHQSANGSSRSKPETAP